MATRISHRRLDFQVTVEDIEAATPADSGHCMIADALKRAYPQAQAVTVDLQSIRFSHGERRYAYLTPRPAQVALLAFDHGRGVEPFRVVAQVAQVSETAAARAKRRAVEGGTTATRQAARVESLGEGRAPVKVGGKSAPVARLASGKGSRGGSRAADAATGRRRAFGMRAMGVPPELADDV